MSFKEITQNVERMELLEERLGVRLQGLMATVDDEVVGSEHKLKIAGEIYSASGGSLDSDVMVDIVAQNEKGQVVGMLSLFINRDKFVGYEAFSDSIYCKAFPTRIKIVPRPL